MNGQIRLHRAVWLDENDKNTVQVIDQRQIPFRIVIEDLRSVDDAVRAIKEMHVRGTGGIGSTAAYGMYLATLEAPKDHNFDDYIKQSAKKIIDTRPTAIDLVWAVERQLKEIEKSGSVDEKISTALKTANDIVEEYMECSRKIGVYGLKLIEDLSKKKCGETVNILTHCNAGWLGLSDYGTATAPIYMAFDKGIKVHVWVDETRPRNQGARLTAWELEQHGIPHTVIVDSVGGHLMQHGLVDLVIVGTDRTTYTGDVANKIGTYLKALAAKDNNVPFYVALPSSSIDWKIKDGIEEIPIEERESEEVRYIQGLHNGSIVDVLLTPEKSPAANYGFDVTPARLVTGLITERGICEPSEEGILKLFPEIRGSKESGSRVRFVTEFISDEVPRNPRLEELKYWCRQFHENNLTPLYENASVGNLSFRVENGKNSFIITASAINSKYELPDSCFVKVSSCEIEKSKVYAYGNRKPSSESMLHYAIYIQRPDVNAIFHGHCQEILNSGNKFGIPETSKEEPFGSMELIQRTLEVLEKNKNVNFFLLKNHGFVSLGRTMKDAGELALEMYKKCCE